MIPVEDRTLTDIERRSADEFDHWAEHFDSGLWGYYFRAANRRVAREVIRYAPAAQVVLDIGCGIGGLLAELRSRGCGQHHLGIDLSAGMLGVARARLNDGGVLVARGTAQALPLTSATVDVACCMNAFHHFPDQPAALREVCRVLRPGGTFILLDPSTDGLSRKTWTLMLDRICDEEGLAVYRGRRELREMLGSAGMTHVSSQHYLHVVALTVAKKPLEAAT